MHLISDLEDFFVQATCAAAAGVHKVLGCKDAILADQMAVDAICDSFHRAPFDIRIIAGEGERDKAPMLHLLQEFRANTGRITAWKGTGASWVTGAELDVAIDPLECTTNAAFAKNGAMSVLAVGLKGSMMQLPDVYMQKIVTKIDAHAHGIDLDNSVEQNIEILVEVIGRIEGKRRDEIKVAILDRPRHKQIISQSKSCGVEVILITDGDVEASLLVSRGIHHMYIGSGGAVEGLLSAAALKTMGGSFCGRLEGNGGKKHNIYDFVPGEVLFIATAITDNALISGVAQSANNLVMHSLILNTQNKTEQQVKTRFVIV